MRAKALAKLVEKVNEEDYVFVLSDIAIIQKLVSHTKLLLTQEEYRCLKIVMGGVNKSVLNKEGKKKYQEWFLNQCVVHDLITFDFYQQCENKSILKEAYFDLPADHYAASSQFKFTANKVSFLIGDCRREVEVAAFLNQYNAHAKELGFPSKAVVTDLLQLKSPAEINCFKKTVSSFSEKADLLGAKWQLTLNQKKPSSVLFFNQEERKFFIQKDNANIELKSDSFLNDFKAQYRKERPWYGSIAEWLGFGILRQLNKKSSDTARVEFLFNHVKESAESTTAKTLESLFHTTDFIADFKKQYRKERPWYGFVSEKAKLGTLASIDKQKNAPDFLRSYVKTKADSTTAKTLKSLEQFSTYSRVPADKAIAEETNRVCDVAVSNDRLSVEAIIKMRGFEHQRVDFQAKAQKERDTVEPDVFAEFEKKLELMAPQEKMDRVLVQKKVMRAQLLNHVECELKKTWMSVNEDEKNINLNPKRRKYIEAKDPGVRKVECHLYFADNEIAALAAYGVDDGDVKKHQWIQSMRVLYTKFSVMRDSLSGLLLSDEGLDEHIREFMRAVRRLSAEGFIDSSVTDHLSMRIASYQHDLEKIEMSVASAQQVMSHARCA